MKTSKLVALAAAASLAFAPVSSFGLVAPLPAPKTFSGNAPAGFWVIFGCAGSIIAAAIIANYRLNRQLTPKEAATCGLTFWLVPIKPR